VGSVNSVVVGGEGCSLDRASRHSEGKLVLIVYLAGSEGENKCQNSRHRNMRQIEFSHHPSFFGISAGISNMSFGPVGHPAG
jgi:hypothetical protein